MKYIFEFDDYKAYLREVEAQRASLERGFRTRLAEVLGCRNAYVSHVLNQGADFSLEQGLKIGTFLNLSASERKFFLLLIELGRAGTEELKAHFKAEIAEMRAKHLNLSERVGEATTLSVEAQSTYYSHWIYAAIHMLTTLSSQRDVSTIASSLRLPIESVRSALVFLTSVGLVYEKGGKLYAGTAQVHLGKNSPQIRQHHTNWRLAAIDSLVHLHRNDVHYSTVSTLSLKDAGRLRAQFAEQIEKYVKTVKDSKEEAMYGFNLDFYSLTRENAD